MFYHISAKVNAPKEVGKGYPQVHCLTQKEAAHRIMHDEFPDFLPDLRFELNKGAKLSDLLSQAAISAHGILISKRMKVWIEGFNLGRHAFYPAKVFTRNGEEHPYFFLHILPVGAEAVDFPRTRFFLRKGLKNIGGLDVSSYDDYVNKEKEHGFMILIEPSHLVLNQGSHMQFDLFALPIPYGRILASEHLAKKLASVAFMGIECTPLTNVEVSPALADL
jgi:hypothetical protein